MKVELASIKPNPFRDFTIDPIDENHVTELRESVKEFSLLPGLTGRELDDGTIELAFGHHRLNAAIAEKVKVGDIHLDDFTDEEMVRLYAMENATQRGASPSAMAGCIAAALKHHR